MTHLKTIVKFIPSGDSSNFIQAAQEYNEIWQKDGIKILETIEKISGLPFPIKTMDVIIYEGISTSGPVMHLRASYTHEQKQATFVHELIHQHLDLHGISHTDFGSHQLLDLILYDIWIDLYGKEFADRSVEVEKNRTNPTAPYKECWEWALSKTLEERIRLFEEIKNKCLNKDNGKQI